MPDDRMLHRRLCYSETVSGLTDFEFRVWVTYILAADDYGVMRFSAAALRSANDALEHKTITVLDRAFQRLVDVGLIRTFAHQGKAFAYQHDWQFWQHINRPRASVLPSPPLDHIEECEPETRASFRTRLEFTGESPADGQVDAALVKPQHRNSAPRVDAPDRQTAHGKRHTANGTSDLRERFDRFWESFPRKVGKGAAWRVWARLRPDAALLDKMRDTLAWQSRDPQWLKNGGQYIPHPQTWLNQERWNDQPVDVPQISDKTARTMGAIFNHG